MTATAATATAAAAAAATQSDEKKRDSMSEEAKQGEVVQHGHHRARDPFDIFRGGMLRVFDDFERDLIGRPGGTAEALAPFQRMDSLSLDIKETDDSFQIVSDIPGMEKADINIHLKPNGVLTISAERKREEETKGEKWHRVERSFGRVERAVRLPNTADPEAVNATYTDGVLNVTIGKRPAPSDGTRRIEIG